MAQELLLSPGENIKPEFTIEEAKEFLDEIFGLKCLQIVELNGYDDKNYKVEVVEEECGCILKIMNSLDSKNLAFVEGCNALLQFLGKYSRSSRYVDLLSKLFKSNDKYKIIFLFQSTL